MHYDYRTETLKQPGWQGDGLALAPAAAPLVLHVFPSFATGGAQVRFCAIANRFGARWRHGVIALDGCHDCAERLHPTVVLDRLTLPVPLRGMAGKLMAIRGALRRLRPAVLVTSNWGSMDWVFANLVPPRIRHLHMEDGFGPEESAGQFRRRILTRRMALRRSTVVVPSTTLQRTATELWCLPRGRLRYVPNGLDLRRFRPDGLTERLLVPGEGPLVGSVATLREEKNLARLVRAVALLLREGTPLRLAIVGDGPERQALQTLVAELGIAGSVLFAGHVADPAAVYRGFDVFALSSNTEQMPFSVLEAMATGLPVAATRVGDLGTMLATENLGHLSALDDAALAAAMRPLLQNAALRERLGASNRRKAECDYDEETMFQAYAALLDGT